jgi:branched-chain amino acid transport system substrate-binding protein
LRAATLGYHGSETDFTNLTEIRIGWFGPTNADDPLTGDLWWAANLAIREANARTSDFGPRASDFLRLPFRLVPRWAVDPWGSGVSQLTRMVYDEQPLALLGSVDSATTHLAEQVVAKANLPLVSPIATDKSVTLAGVSWMFACAPSDAAVAPVLVDAILANLKHPGDKLVLLTVTDHESRMTTREALREFSRRGRRPDFRFEVPPGAADIGRQIQSLAEVESAVVLVIAGVKDAARLVTAVREQAASAQIYGSQAMGRASFLKCAGAAAEGVRFPLLFIEDTPVTNTARFVERFRAERHHPPDYTAALAYDATGLLVEAIRRAGPNRARIREALHQLPPWAGVAGPIRFDGTGQNMRTNLNLGTIRNGVIVALKP